MFPALRSAAVGVLGLAVSATMACSRESPNQTPTRTSPSADGQSSAIAPAAVGGAAPTHDSGAPAFVDLTQKLAPIATNYELPGLVAAVFEGTTLLESGVFGYRRKGDDSAVTFDDKWSLGACTKAITASLAGILVDEGKLSFESTLDALFPDAKIHPSRANATLMMLLQHHAGMERDPDAALLKKASSAKDPVAARKNLVTALLARPNPQAIGTYAYSNVGYLAAGLAIERAGGKPFETLARERIFTPLGMTSCGFGPAHTDDAKATQPVGHIVRDGRVEPAKRTDETELAEMLDPSSGAHCSVTDWAKFLQLHVRLQQGSEPIVSRASLTKLHTPAFNKNTIPGFWFERLEWAGPGAMHQFGSSGAFYADAWVVPAKRLTFLIATNADNATTKAAIEKTSEVLFKRFGK